MNIHSWMTVTTAAEVMSRQLFTIRPAQPLADAASLMLRQQITGVPIVDDKGSCLGVLSASDVLGAPSKVDREREGVAKSSFWSSDLALPVSVYAEKLEEVQDRIAPAADQPVERFMTTDVVAVSPRGKLAEVVQKMVDAHIHRVLVVSNDGRLEGLISTTDVLAALLEKYRSEAHLIRTIAKA